MGIHRELLQREDDDDFNLIFWQVASSASLDEVWDNDADDIYAELLEA